jgi:hypothetical protein
VHGSGSGRFSPRHQYVARVLQEAGQAHAAHNPDHSGAVVLKAFLEEAAGTIHEQA